MSFSFTIMKIKWSKITIVNTEMSSGEGYKALCYFAYIQSVQKNEYRVLQLTWLVEDQQVKMAKWHTVHG